MLDSQVDSYKYTCWPRLNHSMAFDELFDTDGGGQSGLELGGTFNNRISYLESLKNVPRASWVL